MRKLVLLFLLLASVPAHAIDADFEGYADVRLVIPSDQVSWLDGGLGKLRYGDEDGNFQFAELVGQGRLLLTPEFSVVAVLRFEQSQRTPVDVLEAYVRYRPVSTTPWRWSVKAGAFFPPISLENTEIGWTSHWTLTPSAINSWVGNELRTIGGEGKVEWRREEGTLALTGALYGWNDPEGVMIADRGWTLDDRPTGLLDHLRLPDATEILFGKEPPGRTPIFTEIDHRAGWYAGVVWDDMRYGRFEILRYDNLGDPAAENENDIYAWDTHFWSAGYSKEFGEFTVLLQGMTGATIIEPHGFRSITDYDSAFALLGWERGNWRLAARAEFFETRQSNPGPDLPFSEHGHAFTAAASWLPYEWVRLTAEGIYVDSTREEREIVDLDPHQTEVQFQLSGRVYF